MDFVAFANLVISMIDEVYTSGESTHTFNDDKHFRLLAARLFARIYSLNTPDYNTRVMQDIYFAALRYLTDADQESYETFKNNVDCFYNIRFLIF